MKPIIESYPTIILADGAFPTHSVPLSLLREARQIICCDGAAVSLLEYGICPSFIVGDMDSLPEEFKEKYSSIVFPNTDQEINDVTKAILFCKEKGWERISILGATGKREDHSIANLSLIADYAETIDVQLLTDYGVFVPQLRPLVAYESFAGQQVSIFSITPGTVLSSKGLKYAIRERQFTSWWQGSLNEAQGDSFEIKTDSGKVLIFRQFDAG